MWVIEASVVIVLFYLETFQAKADALSGLLSSSLGVLGMNVIIVKIKLQKEVKGANAEQISKQ